MSMTNGEAATGNPTDKATYERLQKDVIAVKNDIAALTEQITDASEQFCRHRLQTGAAATSRRAPMRNRLSTTCPSAAAR